MTLLIILLAMATIIRVQNITFFFNELERRSLLLSDQTVTPDGHLERSPTLHNLDKEYQFMPRYAKQVSSRELIVPCQYRNFTCFAKNRILTAYQVVSLFKEKSTAAVFGIIIF